MKKALSLLAGAMVGISAMAQNGFFEYTPYVGAFAPQPATRWTDGWTNFDPQNANYGAVTDVITTNITTNTTWTADKVYLLSDAFVRIIPGVTLTIEPGTVIRGTGKGTLIVERGATLNAAGTASNPIVFTSNAPAGSRNYGDWGGVVILGAGTHNLAAGPNAEAEGGIGDAVGGVGIHGGTDNNDNSGVLTYVRIEFCGIALTPNPNSEINGLSMYSVGRGTTVSHIQVSYSGDDSFEWFGGAVDCRYLVAFRGWDDDFDTDNGFSGRVQFACSVRDPQVADQSGSNGFESDNDANGSSRTPKTKAVFSNVTVVGPMNATIDVDSANSNYKRALHIRRNSGIKVFNSIFMGYPDAGFLLDARKTAANYCGDTLEFKANILGGCTNDLKLSSADTLCITNLASFVTLAMGDNDTLNTSEAVMLVSPYTIGNPDLRPQGGSPAVNGSDFSFTEDFLAVEENEVTNLSIYPNPASSIVTVSFNAGAKADAKITLLDLAGKVVSVVPVYQVNNGVNQFTFDVTGLSSGIYMLNIQSASFSKVEKVIVR